MADYIKRDYTLRLMWNALYALEDKQEADHGLDLIERKATQDGFEAGQQAVVNAPAADVVEVVRCGKCKHGKKVPKLCSVRECRQRGLLYGRIVNNEFFCADGERRKKPHATN